MGGTWIASLGLQPCTKMWLQVGERHTMGAGVASLLRALATTDTFRQAAGQAGMSYRHAWDLVRTAEGELGIRLLETHPGGRGGGRTRLTSEAESLLEIFERLQTDVAAFAMLRFDELRAEPTATGQVAMPKPG